MPKKPKAKARDVLVRSATRTCRGQVKASQRHGFQPAKFGHDGQQEKIQRKQDGRGVLGAPTRCDGAEQVVAGDAGTGSFSELDRNLTALCPLWSSLGGLAVNGQLDGLGVSARVSTRVDGSDSTRPSSSLQGGPLTQNPQILNAFTSHRLLPLRLLRKLVPGRT